MSAVACKSTVLASFGQLMRRMLHSAAEQRSNLLAHPALIEASRRGLLRTYSPDDIGVEHVFGPLTPFICGADVVEVIMLHVDVADPPVGVWVVTDHMNRGMLATCARRPHPKHWAFFVTHRLPYRRDCLAPFCREEL